jgi:hypothetical protein
MRIYLQCAVLLALVTALIVGCVPSREERAKAECVRNMEIIWGAAGSYCLENKKSPDFICSPQLLTNLIKYGRVPRCPSGDVDYNPFVVDSGPRCPSRPDLHSGHKYPK